MYVISDYMSSPRDIIYLTWPYGVACPRMGCGSADVRYISGRRSRWFCRDCKRQFTAKVGTIFEDSPIGFDKWLPAVWLLTADRNGISSYEIHRALGVTQKTAWFMLHRIRQAMSSNTFEKLSGEVEVDGTYIGPRGRSMHRRNSESTPKKGGRGPGYMKTTVPNSTRKALLPKVFENVQLGATVYTDALGSYHDLREAYLHHVINHAEKYVEGQVHTNSIENSWSVLKRTISGTYICPRAKHLDAYLDEQIFRFNERENTDGPRFAKALKGVDGRRLTYHDLTKKIAK
jgi:transposase-like protein